MEFGYYECLWFYEIFQNINVNELKFKNSSKNNKKCFVLCFVNTILLIYSTTISFFFTSTTINTYILFYIMFRMKWKRDTTKIRVLFSCLSLFFFGSVSMFFYLWYIIYYYYYFKLSIKIQKFYFQSIFFSRFSASSRDSELQVLFLFICLFIRDCATSHSWWRKISTKSFH